MGLFGKVLAVFNVLAALAFVAVAAGDYSARQQWSYSHFRHQLAVHGLPVANGDDSWRLPGRSIANDLTPTTLQQVFQSAGGNPSKNQVDEVQSLLRQVKGEVDVAADLKAKRDALARYLIPLTTRGDERDEVIRRLRSAQP